MDDSIIRAADGNKKIMDKNVTIYTLSTCPFCVQAKEYLRTKGVAYEEKGVDESSKVREELIELSGQHGVPVIVVNGDVVVGYNRTMLDALLTDN